MCALVILYDIMYRGGIVEKINYKAFNRLISLITILVILGILFSLNMLENVKDVFRALTPFYLALLILWIMKPFSILLQNKLNLSVKKANIIAILVNLLIVLMFIFVLLPILIIQVWNITQNSTQIITNIQENFNQLTTYFQLQQIDIMYEIQQKLSEYFNFKSFQDILSSFDFSIITNGINAILSAIGSVTSFVINIIFSYILALYLANDFDIFVEKTLNLFFKNRESKNKLIFLESTNALSGYFKGILLDCFFVATIVSIGATLISIPSPLLFGILAGIFNVIPYLGPILGGVPLIVVALSQGIPVTIAATCIVFGTQLIESQILQPKIMSTSTNLHPGTIIIGLIIFGSLFGLVGMVISTPTLAVISVILKHSNFDIRI